jgi:hypothetical protein
MTDDLIEFLHDQIDGGIEMRGRDSQITTWIMEVEHLRSRTEEKKLIRRLLNKIGVTSHTATKPVRDDALAYLKKVGE